MSQRYEDNLTYSPMGKWGASYTGRATITPFGDQIGFEWIGPITKVPAPRWRRLIRWAILNHWWELRWRLRGER